MKKTILFIVVVTLLSTNSVSAQELDLRIKVTNFPGFIIEGGTIQLKFEIFNPNNITLEDLRIKYIIRKAGGPIDTYLQSDYLYIDSIEPKETFYREMERPLQMAEGGLFNILMSAQNNYDKHNSNEIKINGEIGENIIRHKVQIYTLNDFSIIVNVILGFIIIFQFYRSHLYTGSVKVSYPRYYRLSNEKTNKNAFLFIPLCFINTGVKTRAISNISIIIENMSNNKKYFFELENEYEKFGHSAKDMKNNSIAPQFTIGPKSSITKFFLFMCKDCGKIDNTRYKIQIMGWLEDEKEREILLEFKSNFGPTAAYFDLLDIWKDIYDKEINRISRKKMIKDIVLKKIKKEKQHRKKPTSKK